MNLESWEKLVHPRGMHSDPSENGFVLKGRVYGHDAVANGSELITGIILGYDFRDACFVDENGYEYRLKDPDPAYEQRFPNAKAKVEKAITARRFMMSSVDYATRYTEGNKAA